MGAPNSREADPIRAAFLHSPELEQCHYPPDFPFRTERAGMVRKIASSMGLLTGPGRREVTSGPASTGELLAFHTQCYLDALRDAPRERQDAEALRMGLGTGDNPIFEGMYDCAVLACGATLEGAKLILAGEAHVAFNPSGGYHHAGPAKASGFCYVNDAAIGCLHLAAAGKRVVYLDIDAHHGDGVQNAFYDRRDVMTISLHESGETLFPGTGFAGETGTGEGEGYSVNVPLPIGVYDEAYLRAIDAVALPMIRAFAPDAIVLELGMDGLAGDPLTHMNLTNNAHAEVIRRVLDFGRPVLALGGGGYNIANTVRAWALAWSVLCGHGEAADEMAAGLGGAVMETTDQASTLRDLPLTTNAHQRADIDPAVNAAIEQVKASVFPLHGL